MHRLMGSHGGDIHPCTGWWGSTKSQKFSPKEKFQGKMAIFRYFGSYLAMLANYDQCHMKNVNIGKNLIREGTLVQNVREYSIQP